MIEMFAALVFASLFLSPRMVAATCASERRLRQRRDPR